VDQQVKKPKGGGYWADRNASLFLCQGSIRLLRRQGETKFCNRRGETIKSGVDKSRGTKRHGTGGVTKTKVGDSEQRVLVSKVATCEAGNRLGRAVER